MPAVVMSTETVHGVGPTTVPSTSSSPPHESNDKSQEAAKANNDADAASAGGFVPDDLPPTELQPATKNGSTLRPFNIEDVPVMNDPRQWSQRRKVRDEVI